MTRCCVRDQNRGRALFRQVVLAEVGLTDEYLRCGAANCSSVAADSSTDLCRCDHRDDGARSCPHQETSVHVRAGVGNYPAAFHSFAEMADTKNMGAHHHIRHGASSATHNRRPQASMPWYSCNDSLPIGIHERLCLFVPGAGKIKQVTF